MINSKVSKLLQYEEDNGSWNVIGVRSTVNTFTEARLTEISRENLIKTHNSFSGIKNSRSGIGGLRLLDKYEPTGLTSSLQHNGIVWHLLNLIIFGICSELLSQNFIVSSQAPSPEESRERNIDRRLRSEVEEIYHGRSCIGKIRFWRNV